MKIVSVGLILHTEWVVDAEYAKAAYSTCHIVQHYVSLDENGNETRDGKAFTLTIKGKSSSNGLIRVDITADAFASLSAISDK